MGACADPGRPSSIYEQKETRDGDRHWEASGEFKSGTIEQPLETGWMEIIDRLLKLL